MKSRSFLNLHPVGLLLTASCFLTACASSQTSRAEYQPRVREYFIAAEQVAWDYAPTGKNQIKPGAGLGDWGERTVYPKARYVEYTDGTFEEVKPQPTHLGLMGPTIRAAVGDTIRVHFLNRTDLARSIHPHGVFYDKDNEGAPYAGIPGKGHAIEPGEQYTYTWGVPERAGPGPDDPSSIVWVYHSHVDSVRDIYAGLLGAIIIVDDAHARIDATPSDVDREFVNLFMVFNESPEGEEVEGDLMHAINGRIFGNLDGLTMKQGERVRWHLIGMGTEVDLHTPHWHGETVLHQGHRKDSIDLLAGSMTSVDMVASNPGTWLYHCHVTDHITAGMIALYTVAE